jgi:uncharacterized membrane protein YcaP (DUF421 family)
MYGYTIFLLRFLGKRGMGQLSTLELAIIISFGSAIGDPMVGAEMPIAYGVVAVTTVALLQVGMERLINRHEKIEKIVEGTPNTLVDNGLIVLENLRKENLSHQDLFRALREKEVRHLGEVSKAIFETSGQITVVFRSPRKIQAGLSILPQDELPQNSIKESPFQSDSEHVYCCMNCGHCTRPIDAQVKNCSKCSNNHWLEVPAVGAAIADGNSC